VCLRQQRATVERLSSEIDRLLGDRSTRIAMANASAACGHPNAAHEIGMDLLALAAIPVRAKGSNAVNGVRRLVAPVSASAGRS